MGANHAKPPGANVARVRELAAAGRYAADIARTVNITRERVRQLANKYAIQIKTFQEARPKPEQPSLLNVERQGRVVVVEPDAKHVGVRCTNEHFQVVTRQVFLHTLGKCILCVSAARRTRPRKQRYGSWRVLDDLTWVPAGARVRAVCDCGTKARRRAQSFIATKTQGCVHCAGRRRVEKQRLLEGWVCIPQGAQSTK